MKYHSLNTAFYHTIRYGLWLMLLLPFSLSLSRNDTPSPDNKSCIKITTNPDKVVIKIPSRHVSFEKTSDAPVNFYDLDPGNYKIKFYTEDLSFTVKVKVGRNQSLALHVDVPDKSYALTKGGVACEPVPLNPPPPPPPPKEPPLEPFETWEVSEKAEFEYGNKSFGEFITENIRYPKMALDSGIQGRILVEFVVETSGVIRRENVKYINQRIGYGLEEEAMRVVLLSSGMWKPAMQKGSPVRMKFRQPIRFSF